MQKYFLHASSARQLRPGKHSLCSQGNCHCTLGNGQLHALQPNGQQWQASVSIRVYSIYTVSAHFKSYEHGIDVKSDDIAETQFKKLWDLMRYSERAKQNCFLTENQHFGSICMDKSLAHSDVSVQIFKIWLESWCFDPSQGFTRSHYSKTGFTSCLKSAITHWCFATKEILSCCFRCSQQFQ